MAVPYWSSDCLIGLVVVSATTEQEVLLAILGSGKMLLVFFVRKFTVAGRSLSDGYGKLREQTYMSEVCFRTYYVKSRHTPSYRGPGNLGNCKERAGFLVCRSLTLPAAPP